MADAKSEAIDRLADAFCGADVQARRIVIAAVNDLLYTYNCGSVTIDSILCALVALHAAQEAEDAQCKR